jgi:hypothetical protein
MNVFLSFLDIDECALKVDTCDVNAVCINTIGSYSCHCKNGYRGSGQQGECYSKKFILFIH